MIEQYIEQIVFHQLFLMTYVMHGASLHCEALRSGRGEGDKSVPAICLCEISICSSHDVFQAPRRLAPNCLLVSFVCLNFLVSQSASCPDNKWEVPFPKQFPSSLAI